MSVTLYALELQSRGEGGRKANNCEGHRPTWNGEVNKFGVTRFNIKGFSIVAPVTFLSTSTLTSSLRKPPILFHL